jgi:hypothetical protein
MHRALAGIGPPRPPQCAHLRSRGGCSTLKAQVLAATTLARSLRWL